MLEPRSAFVAQSIYHRYLHATAPAEHQALLTELLAAHVAPLTQIILKQKLRAQASTDDLLEMQQQIHAKLLMRLRAPNEPPLEDFPSYVAVVAFNTCAEWQRQRQPQRHALKNRLRYLLTHTPGLALWEAQPRIWWGGRSHWQTHPQAARLVQLDACRDDLPRTTNLGELTQALFARLAQPAELDDLVNLFAEVLGIRDEPAPARVPASQTDPLPNAETVVERRAYLQKLWLEIKQLPGPQRSALLLNLRAPDGGNQLALFHLTGIAGLRELAEAVEVKLNDLLELWKQLPLDDLALAARLGITRQQVINLRLAARRRLTRRLGLP